MHRLDNASEFQSKQTLLKLCYAACSTYLILTFSLNLFCKMYLYTFINFIILYIYNIFVIFLSFLISVEHLRTLELTFCIFEAKGEENANAYQVSANIEDCFTSSTIKNNNFLIYILPKLKKKFFLILE